MQNAETVLGVLRGSLESPVPRNGHAGFGGRPHGKGPAERQAPRRAVDPTLSHGALTRVLATGAHVLWRARADIDLPVISVLDDGTYTSRVADPKTSRRLRREGKSGADIPGITVRVIEYSVTTGADTDVCELFCLVTDLLDPRQLSAPQAAQAYGQRWRIETAFAELATGIRGGPAVVLRSKSPDMIRQELYAMLCTYQAIRTLICHAAAAEGLDPDRISFTRAKEAIAARVTGAAAFSPADLADLHDDLIAEITHRRHLVPVRPPRAYARARKRPRPETTRGPFPHQETRRQGTTDPPNEDHILATTSTDLKLMPLGLAEQENLYGSQERAVSKDAPRCTTCRGVCGGSRV